MAQILKTYTQSCYPYHSNLWAWLLVSFAIHTAIFLIFFVRFESLQFKKGTSQLPTKVASFQILGGGENIAKETRNMSSNAPSQQHIPTPTKPHTEQTSKAFDLSSLSLYDKNNYQTNQKQAASSSANASQSPIKALAKFPGVDNIARRDIEELYGEEFGDYGLAEQEFLVNNLRDIGRITQRYLQYPPSAARLGQQGVSAVEFYLHPNGDISELKVILSSEYMLLDRNSERTIEIAYKDYPHPRTKTKIRIFVTYGLYYYRY